MIEYKNIRMFDEAFEPVVVSNDFLTRLPVSRADSLKPLATLGEDEIVYRPHYYAEENIPLKPTSKIVPYEGEEGQKEAILVKPELRTIFDVTRSCTAHCPACINAMYDASMPEETRTGIVARTLTNESSVRAAEATIQLRALTSLDENYFAGAKLAAEFSVQRAGSDAYSFTGGEPTLLGSKLIRLFEVVPKVSKVKLFTHGGPLLKIPRRWEPGRENERYDDNMLNELVKRGLNELVISRHDTDEAANFDYMGKGVPNDENLKEIVKQAKEKGVYVRFSTLVQAGHIDTVEKMIKHAEFARSIGLDEITFRALATTQALDPEAQTDVVTKWVDEHRVDYEEIFQAMVDSDYFKLGNRQDQHVKTRSLFKAGDLKAALEFKHDPEKLETDAGVFTVFPSVRPLPNGGGPEGAMLSYRWIDPIKHSVNYRGKDWTEGQPYFRAPQPKVRH